ncbi:hypothetical protein [Nonomuraea turcica]|uniref:hypothetical protein n=1 Tax=Nonomuraea sp. G32 TaxID=3067274 RepID=UPI00273C055D|nr:hypothetical protein [Nonomuraea sp. G32]MDP4509998.1 hypothetical protein [Nonomuraea sp. G32]
MTRSRQTRSLPARTITPPRRDRHGGFSPAWLLMQAARLSWEIRNVLQLINGMRLNLSEELHIHSEASDMLLNAAHATAIMEARLPLAPAWGSGPPRARSIFAQAREAGTDPAEVRPDVELARPPIDPQIICDVEAAYREDPDPDAQCAGTTLKKDRCAKTIVTGIGSEHCAVHLTPAERQRRDKLRAAQDRRMQAIQDALEEHRLTLATAWIDRYGHRPHRVELPAAPSRPRQVIPFDGHPGLTLGKDEQAMLALFDTGWPTLCPRSAEIVGALLDCPRATTARLAELAAAQTPERWSSPQQWLDSGIWDGIQPPGLDLPAAGEDPGLDEYPPVQVLRHHIKEDHAVWERWQAGFATLIEACDDPPVDTMADLLAFWQDIGILISHGNDAGHPVWSLDTSPPSPWRVVYARGPLVPPHILAAALDWLLDQDVPLDADLPPREVFNLIMTSSAHHGPADNASTSGAVGVPG